MRFQSPFIRKATHFGLFVAMCVWGAVAWKSYSRLHLKVQLSIKPELLPIEITIPTWDGSYPTLVVTLSRSKSRDLKFVGAISMKELSVHHDGAVNEFDVALDSGMFVLRQTDIFVPDLMPLSLTRTYRPWDYHSRSFGVGANHPYDICPTGTRFPYTYMDLNLEDGRQVHFPRISKGTGYADAVFQHTNTSSEFYGAQVAWNGNGWTLDFKDHRQFSFPEAYRAANYAQGAPFEMRDGSGHNIQLKRDAARNLEELISPSGHTINFKYDNAARIVKAWDDAGNIRNYSYDSSGHLEIVSDETGILYRFEYARLLHEAGYDPYIMTTVMDGKWRILVKNFYGDNSRVSEQEFANGDIYQYKYVFDSKHQIVKTVVTFPNGKVRQFNFNNGVPLNQSRRSETFHSPLDP